MPGPNIPQGGVEDIFGNVEAEGGRKTSATNTPFTASTPLTPKGRPFDAVPPSPGTQFPPSMSPMPEGMKNGGEKNKSGRGIKIIGIGLAIVVVLLAGGFGVYWYLTSTSTVTPPPTPTSPINQTGTNKATPVNQNIFSNINTTVNTGVTPAIDSDGDGLTDQEEVTYQTNPKLADSDIDGLNDYVEVKTYNTNPNKADSDGDTFNDGMEINGGYNPNGPGRLVEIPATNTSTGATNSSGITPTNTTTTNTTPAGNSSF